MEIHLYCIRFNIADYFDVYTLELFCNVLNIIKFIFTHKLMPLFLA